MLNSVDQLTTLFGSLNSPKSSRQLLLMTHLQAFKNAFDKFISISLCRSSLPKREGREKKALMA
jgi:hypothetical protein